MRNLMLEGLDTFRPGKVPKGANAELRYRARPRRRLIANYYTQAWLLGGAIFLPLLTILFRISNFASHPLGLLLMILVAVAISVIRFAKQQGTLGQMVTDVLIAVAIWLSILTLARTSDAFIGLVALLPVALIAVLWVADHIATYYIEFLAASPNLTQEQEVQVLASWRHRRRTPAFRSGMTLLQFCYAGGIVAFLALRSFGLDLHGPSLVILLILGGLGIATEIQLRKYSLAANTVFGQMWKAIRLWCTYTTHPFAPGLYRGQVRPFGEIQPMGRVILLLGAAWLASMAIVPTARYFPVLYVANEGWQASVPKPEINEKSKDEVYKNLSDKQQEIYKYLADGVKRQEYLKALIALDYDARYQAAYRVNKKAYRSEITTLGHAWILSAIKDMSGRPTASICALTFAAFFSAFSPMFFFFCVLVICYGPSVSLAIEEMRHLSTKDFCGWERYVKVMQNSGDKTERESLWLGVHDEQDYPILLHREILHEHAHILGDSGSGKTALGLTPMISQIIRMAGRDALDDKAEKSSCVIIDLKGDPALFHAARLEAEKAKLPFKWFTNQKNCSSFSFNPLLQSHTELMTTNQRAQVLLEALGLAYGVGYGRGHFSSQNRLVLSRIMQAFEGSIQSFAGLYEYAQEGKRDLLGNKLGVTKKEREDAGDVFAAIEGLSEFEALNITDGSGYPAGVVENAIDFGDVIKTPQVIYFYLAGAIESATVQDIGKLALFSLLSAALTAETEMETSNQVYLIIDEFQQIVAENLEVLLRQARSKKIAMILANQTISDLNTPAVNLIPTVQANTRFKQFFASTDLEQQEQLMRASGDTVHYLYSWQQDVYDPEHFVPRLSHDTWLNPPVPLEDNFERMGTRLTRNDLISISDDESLSVVHIPRGKGYSQFGGFPFVLQSTFHITEDTYKKRMRLRWPKANATIGSFVPSSATDECEEQEDKTFRSAPPSDDENAESEASTQERFSNLLREQQASAQEPPNEE